MTIQTSTSKVIFQGNGATTVFTYSFPMPSASNAVVLFTDASGNQTTVSPGAYVLTGVGQPTAGGGAQGGTLTYAPNGSPIAAGTTLTLMRVIPYVQPDSFTNQGGLWPLVVEASDDNLEMQVQQLAEQLGRALLFNAADPGPFGTFPTAALRALQLLGFDSLGNPITAQPGSALISSVMQPVTAAASIAAALALLGIGVLTGNNFALSSALEMDNFCRADYAARTVPIAVTHVRTNGYYTQGDGGGALYERLVSAPAYEFFTDLSGAFFGYVFEGEVNIRQFGCKGDLSVDCSAKILSAWTYAAGRSVYAPVGQYKMSAGIAYGGIVHMRGDGHGCGPGPAAISNSGCTQFLAFFSNQQMFSVTTNFACSFRDFQINVDVGSRPQSTGIGIGLSGAIGATNANTVIERVGFSNVGVPILFTRTAAPKILSCYMDEWITAGVFIQTTAGIEGTGGEISHSFFFGPAGTVGQGPAIFSNVGYLNIHHNTFTGGAGNIDIVITTFPAGSIIIHDNHLEDYTLYAIQVTSGDGTALTMLQIHDNEISSVAFAATAVAAILVVDTGATYVDLVSVRGNIIRSVQGAASSFINVNSGSSVIVAENQLTNLGVAVSNAVSVAGARVVAPAIVRDNLMVGSYTVLYNLNSTVILRDTVNPITFAALPTCGNGSEIYVTDGRNTNAAAFNFALRNGGSGCVAQRQQGGWLTLQA